MLDQYKNIIIELINQGATIADVVRHLQIESELINVDYESVRYFIRKNKIKKSDTNYITKEELQLYQSADSKTHKEIEASKRQALDNMRELSSWRIARIYNNLQYLDDYVKEIEETDRKLIVTNHIIKHDIDMLNTVAKLANSRFFNPVKIKDNDNEFVIRYESVCSECGKVHSEEKEKIKNNEEK